MSPIIISFYTKNTFYESEVQNLIESCKKFDLEYQIEAVDSLGSWEYNCCYKPIFILKKLLTLKKPVLWIDADGVIVKKPDLHWKEYSDIALRLHESLSLDHPSKVCTMSLFADYTKEALELIRLWKEECLIRLLEKCEDQVWDQKCLRDVIYQKTHHAKVHPIPMGYCRIYDKESDKVPKEETYIIHYQASRLYKKIIDGEVIAFNGLEKLSGKEIQKLRTGNLHF